VGPEKPAFANRGKSSLSNHERGKDRRQRKKGLFYLSKPEKTKGKTQTAWVRKGRERRE